MGGHSGDQFIPSDAEIDSFFGFAAAANVKVVFGLNLESATPSEDASEAQYIWDHYATNLICFAIGNEPNEYPASTGMTNFASYFATWQTFASAVLAAAPGAVLEGPDNDSANTSYAPDFCEAEQGNTNVPCLSYHYKPLRGSNGKTPPDIASDQLSSNLDNSTYPSCYNSIAVAALSNGLSYRLSEFNPYYYNSTTNNLVGEDMPFSATLYALDILHWWAAAGCLGVHYHTGPGTGFLSSFYYDQNGNIQAYSVCYGMAAFNIGGYGSAEPLTITNTGGLNLTAYAVGSGTNLYVTVINREYGTGARNAAVTILPGGFFQGHVSAMFLVQSNSDVTATNGVTLGGASISGTGPWLGQWTALGALTNGQCVVSVPASSAAVVRIQDTTIGPPTIVQDLPPQIFLAPGQTYLYSVEAESGLPLSYQWYRGATPVIGQTNATYTATAGGFGSQASYFVVVSNPIGSVTSLVSTLTVVAPATNSYANTIEHLNPVGYWPLQETNAPAPATIETNYGSLGALGNAYYAATNPADVLFEQAGLPGGNDLSVKFLASGAVTPDSFAFVPRISPAVTLKPPLTLELWLNGDTPSSLSRANTEDVLGEGGSGLDSPPSDGNYGGVRMSWVYDSSTAGPGVALLPASGSGATIGDWEFPVAAGDQWYHYVVTYDGTNFIAYVNGTGQGTNAFAMALDTWSPLTIGCGRWQATDTRAFNGRETEVAVYTNVLSISQISNHYLAGITAGANYAQTILNDNPLLYYRMNCPGYTNPNPLLCPTAVSYGSDTVNGIYLSGTVPGGMAGPPIAGFNSRAAAINGITSCVSVGYDRSLNPTGTHPFTAMAWFMSNPVDGRMQTIMSHGGNTSWALNLVGTNGTVSWSSGAGSVASTGIFNDGNWHFAAGVYDGTNNYLYVDGSLNNFAAAGGGVAGNTNDGVFLGGDPDFTLAGVKERYFAGAIAQAAFLTNALTAGQIQAIYVSAITPPPGLLSLTKMGNSQAQLNWNFGTLQTATNVAGPYNDITNASSPWVIPETNSQQFFRVREN